jgi:hypothetical protein
VVSFTIGRAQADDSIKERAINTFEPGDTITLESLDIQFPIEDAYEGTSLTYEP